MLTGTKIAFKEFMKTNRSKALECITEADENGRCALHFACFMGQADIVTSMLKVNKKALIAQCDAYDWTPLHFSAFGGHLRLTKKLLAESADPNALTSSKMSCLHFLARLHPGDNLKIIAKYQETLKVCLI